MQPTIALSYYPFTKANGSNFVGDSAKICVCGGFLVALSTSALTNKQRHYVFCKDKNSSMEMAKY